MEQENLDPMYEYVDKEIANVKRSFEQSLLETQRNVAAFIITSTTENILSIAKEKKPQLYKRYSPQIYASAGTAKANSKTSHKPLDVAADFHTRCYDSLEALGIEIIRLS